MNQIAAAARAIFLRRDYESRIDRQQSPARMLLVPIVSVLLGSLVTVLPFLVSAPLLPPFGFMILLAWRLMRPGMWPTWIGLPFGLFDDLFSGQPFGSAACLWSLAMLGVEFVDSRVIWRDYLQDWLVASVGIMLLLAMQLFINSLIWTSPAPTVLLPQILLSIMTFPVVVRICARLDNWRLAT